MWGGREEAESPGKLSTDEAAEPLTSGPGSAVVQAEGLPSAAQGRSWGAGCGAGCMRLLGRVSKQPERPTSALPTNGSLGPPFAFCELQSPPL